jgi:phage repressor protein C with HTH and peptisase S24 domain
MLTHQQVWGAVDRMAARYGFSPSGLARAAGLDATTFNPSKRITADGRPRWPSTESLAKILAATGAGLDEFSLLLTKKPKQPSRAVPLIGFAQAGSGGYFDDGGFPLGSGWDEIKFPGVDDEHAYALEVSGNSMEPLFRKGDLLIVSPAAAMRKGDRIVVKTRGGEVLAKELKRKTAKAVELRSLNAEHKDRTLQMSEVAWIARILWVRQ